MIHDATGNPMGVTIKRRPSRWLWFGLLLLWVACVARTEAAAGAHMEILQFESRALKNNPLHDPVSRPIPVFLPAQATLGRRLPVVYYLPGYGSSAAKYIQNSNLWLKVVQKIADEITPVILVVADGKTRWGGSQYLNSTAQGNYEDYVCDDIIPAVEERQLVPTNGVRRIIAGHSSGGFGALRLGGSHPTLFEAVIALSPDSDFPVSHLHLAVEPAVTNVTLAEIQNIAAGKSAMPTNSSLNYLFGLSAAYAPRGFPHRGEFSWLFDAAGKFRPEIWQRWLNNDPLTIVEKHRYAFADDQAIYLDGAAQDQFLANIGARKICQILQTRPGRCAFYEPPGHHSDKIPERLLRGLEWVFNRPLIDVQMESINKPLRKQ